MTYRSAILVLIFYAGAISAIAQTFEKYSLSKDSTVNRLAGTNRVYSALRTDKRPKVDGKLTDACWETGLWSGGFVQQLPKQGHNPSQDTEIKILYDDNNIYVAFKCYDKGPGEIRPILTRRDESVGNGDVVGIAFDSYHDKQTAYEFNVGASGQKVDLVRLVSGDLDYNWDAVWDGQAQVYDSIWTVEMQIPFTQIHFAPGNEQIWGLHVWRWIDRLQEEDQWKLVPVDAPAMVYLFGEVKGIEGVKPKTNYEFLPYLSTRFSPNTDQETKMTNGVGLSGKVGLNSGFTLDYAINPDFGQVESDPAVLNLTTYEVFNEEKRPFFLEGNTILDYSIGDDMLYYSRRIGHAPSDSPDLGENQTMSVADNTSILSAVKLTGKTKDGLSVGVIQSITAKENATIYTGDSTSKQAVEPFSNFMVGRVKQDFNGGNTVFGGMVTSTLRNINDDNLLFLSNSAMSGGLDFQHNWKNRKYFVDYKGFFSDIRGDEEAISRLQRSPVHYFQRVDADHLEYDPTKTSLSGHGGFLSGGKRSGRFRAIGSLNWRSPGIDLNDLGYIRQADYIEQIIKLTYKVNIPAGIVRSYYTEFTQLHNWSFGGENTLDRLNLHGFMQLNNMWLTHMNLRRSFNNFDTRELRGGPMLYKDETTDFDFYIQSNSVNDFWAGVRLRMTVSSDKITKTYVLPMYLKWQVNNQFSITTTTSFDHTIDHHEYIRNTQYLVGTINRNTISSTLRFEYFISPEFSMQYYGNPYASMGTYKNFREVTDASNRSLSERYGSLTQTELPDNKYLLKNKDGHEYTINKPDFNYQEFSSNLVGRWEFRPGSTLYLVWTNTRSAYSDQMDQNIWKSFGSIRNVESQNVFMVKFSYWFSL